MTRRTLRTAILVACLAGAVDVPVLDAHDGPPFPIVSDRVVGAYRLSVWTDPDSTDDGSPGGRFWVQMRPDRDSRGLPPDTRVVVTIRPLDRDGEPRTATAQPVSGDVSNQLAELVMDHEGRFAVGVAVTGALGEAAVDAEVAATYDLRPPPVLIAVYLLPFVLIGFLWIKLLLRRRRRSPQPDRRSPDVSRR